jgi:hypothetical protein
MRKLSADRQDRRSIPSERPDPRSARERPPYVRVGLGAEPRGRFHRTRSEGTLGGQAVWRMLACMPFPSVAFLPFAREPLRN